MLANGKTIMDFNNIKKIWIIGASSGIGAALAKKLANDGKEVVVSARSEEELKKVASYSDKISYVIVDVLNRKSIAAAIGHVDDYDCVIQCHGYYETETIDTFDANEFEKHFQVNVIGTGNLIDPVLKSMRQKGHGRIILTASVAGYHGLTNSMSYGATKAALIHFAESLAVELHGSDISVQVINPGFVKTQLTAKNNFDMPMEQTPEEAADAIIKGMKKGKFEITFPKLFTKPLRWVSMLPYCLSVPLIHKGTKRK